jgi:hypothetical protein
VLDGSHLHSDGIGLLFLHGTIEVKPGLVFAQLRSGQNLA